MSGRSTDRRSYGSLAAAALSLVVASAAAAQYTVPGSLADPPRSSKDRLEQSMSEARWKLGKVRVRPRTWLRNLSYVDNVFSSPEGEEKTSDFRGTFGLGLDAFVNFGPKVVLSTFALAEYNYWREQSQLSGLTGRYGAGLFGFFNRLTVSVDAANLEREELLSSEFQVPVQIEEERARVELQLDLGGPYRLFGSFVDSTTRHDDEITNDVPELQLAALDFDQTVASGGLLFESSRGWSVGLGVERSETDFEVDPDGRSNTGTSPLVRFTLERGELNVGLWAALRQAEFESAELTDLEELTGRGWIIWRLGAKTNLAFYGGRQLVYSAEDTGNYFSETRYGASASRDLGPRVVAGVFVESGEDKYGESGSFGALRVDDVSSFGGSVDLSFARQGSLRIGFSETTYDSNLPQFERSWASVQIGLAISGDALPF